MYVIHRSTVGCIPVVIAGRPWQQRRHGCDKISQRECHQHVIGDAAIGTHDDHAVSQPCKVKITQGRGNHDDVIKWKHFPRYWPFVTGIHRSTVDSHHEGQWRGALMFYFICAWTNGWENNREAGDWRRRRDQYEVTVMDEPAGTSARSHIDGPLPKSRNFIANALELVFFLH